MNEDLIDLSDNDFGHNFGHINIESKSNESINNVPTIFKDFVSKKTSLFERYTIDWTRDIELDHIIPKGLVVKNTPMMGIFNRIGNLQLIHKDCHKIKTNFDLKFFTLVRLVEKHTLYRKTR